MLPQKAMVAMKKLLIYEDFSKLPHQKLADVVPLPKMIDIQFVFMWSSIWHQCCQAAAQLKL